ncbi:homoserine kinase [uncultured Clostridium sp.]|uniref:homoserine kinase n=1 Tax=uncultured Clostridium sp. TaxID=59620 RepID=UPI002607FE4A|nr:homoserine kinase [uncultured Clostridium sp.]
MIYRAKVPATSANVGAGFDTLGLALSLYNTFEVEEISEGLEFIGFEERFSNRENILFTAMKKVFKKANYKKESFKIKLINQDIPITRGLGSSSSCIVAGVLIANKILNNKFTIDETLDIATEIEGHPDNVAPAILGGFVVSVVEKSKVYYNSVEIDRNMKFFVGIPSFELSTSVARKVLPKEYIASDVIYNISRAALTASAFSSKNYDLLKVSCRDKFHEPYRSGFIENYQEVKEIFNENNILCNFLSGAGPTIIGIKKISDNEEKEFISIEKSLKQLKSKWLLKSLKADNIGAIVEER